MPADNTEPTRLVKLVKPQPFETRIIDKASLKKQHLIEIKEDLVWSAENHHTVDASDFSDDLLEIIKQHSEFRIVEPSDGKKSVEKQDEDPERTGEKSALPSNASGDAAAKTGGGVTSKG